MGNHAHLCLRPGTTPLPSFMQRLLTAHAMWFNRRHVLKGHVYQGRYHCSPCDSDRYLLATIRYIHLNPVKHGFTRGPDYRWSTHAEYTRPQTRPWVDAGMGLAHFGGRRRYMEFVQDGLSNGFDLPALPDAPQPAPREVEAAPKLDLAELLAVTGARFSISVARLRGSRGRSTADVNRARVAFALVATRNGHARTAVAGALGISPAAVSRLLTRAFRGPTETRAASTPHLHANS
jgi:hypothetical protein